MLGYLVVVLVVCLAFVVTRYILSVKENTESARECRKLHDEKKILEVRLAQLEVRLEEEKKNQAEKLSLLLKAEESIKASFKAISSDALQETQRSFFDVAKATFDKYSNHMREEWQQKNVAINDVVKPLKESLEKVDNKVQELEKARLTAYASVFEQLKSLTNTQMQLHGETNKLVRALRAPTVRGQWGELQLKRVVEMAGMVQYCDFTEQQSFSVEEGRIRPDLLVRLPNERMIVIDAKAPLQAYLEAVDEHDEEKRLSKLKEHAKHVKKHLSDLSEKAYWERIQPTPEFVVLFLPGEAFFSAALDSDPTLIEYGVDKKVLLATPTTLIALLKAVASGWREQVVHEHARAICELGKSLHERLATMSEHFMRLKKSLDGSVDAYNKAVGSFESRVLTAARRFEEIGVSSSTEIPELQLCEKITRTLEGQHAVE